MSNNKILHGWYSNKQKNQSKPRLHNDTGKKQPRSNIYLTENGEEVEVTEVCSEKDNYNTKTFTDAIYKGRVVKWIRSIY